MMKARVMNSDGLIGLEEISDGLVSVILLDAPNDPYRPEQRLAAKVASGEFGPVIPYDYKSSEAEKAAAETNRLIAEKEKEILRRMAIAEIELERR